MIREEITIENALEVLNRMLKTDPKATMDLISARVSCSEPLANDPEIQIGLDKNGDFTVGFLGVINGLFGTTEEGWGAICAEFSMLCSKDGDHDVESTLGITDDCPICGSALKLGKIIRFDRTQQSFNE